MFFRLLFWEATWCFLSSFPLTMNYANSFHSISCGTHRPSPTGGKEPGLCTSGSTVCFWSRHYSCGEDGERSKGTLAHLPSKPQLTDTSSIFSGECSQQTVCNQSVHWNKQKNHGKNIEWDRALKLLEEITISTWLPYKTKKDLLVNCAVYIVLSDPVCRCESFQ